MERLVVQSARAHWVPTLIASLSFVVAGAFILVMGDQTLVGWMGIIFFGGCAIAAALQINDRRPRLVIDDRGVLDRTLKIGVIQWHDISGAFVTRHLGYAFLCLELRDPAKYTGQLSTITRRLSTVNRSLGFTDFCLNLGDTDLDADRVRELVVKESADRNGRSIGGT
jgi:hypothetical protein